MVDSETKRRRSNCHYYRCSCNWLPTFLAFEASFGKIPTTLLRLITALQSAPIGAKFARACWCFRSCACATARNAEMPVLFTIGLHHRHGARELIAYKFSVTI